MKFEKNEYGYYIEVASLDPNKEYSDYKEDAELLYRNFNDKGYLVPTALTIALRHDGLEVDGYHAWLSDGLDGLASKLDEWARLEPYYTLELDDDQKEEYIDRLIEKYVYPRDSEWLDETFKDAMELYDCETEEELHEVFDYYVDVNLSEIVNYLWDVFYEDNTMYQLDGLLEGILGYYGDAMIAKIEDEGYYLFFN